MTAFNPMTRGKIWTKSLAALSVGLTVLGVWCGSSFAHSGAFGYGTYPPEYRPQHFYFDDQDFAGKAKSKNAIVRGSNHWNALGRSLSFVAHPNEPINASNKNFYDNCDDSPGFPALHDGGYYVGLIFREPLHGIPGFTRW